LHVVFSQTRNFAVIALTDANIYATSSSGHRVIWWGDAMSICNEHNASQDHNA